MIKAIKKIRESIHGAAAISFVLYIVILVIAFAVKNSKAVGITSIIFSIIILIAMGGFGIVGFVLLLAGVIVVITYKDKPQPRYNPDTGELVR
jgi:cation transporter-like permease